MNIKLSPIVGFVLFVAYLLLFVAVAHHVLAQKAERGTQQWNIDMGNGSTIRVIDTTGVCLYVGVGWGGPSTNTVAAVPKSQLPQGTGCQ